MNKDIFRNQGKKLKLIFDSATFALLFSIVLFSYEMISNTKKTNQIVDNLMEIQGSLSTRYLGLFPEYIDNINNLLNYAIEEQNKSDIRDSIIIFEDVLYYGIRSDAEGFREMIENLVTLTNSGCHITIAYYDVNNNSLPFKQMMQDKLISHEYKKQFRDDMNSYRERLSQLRQESASISSKEISQDTFIENTYHLINKHFDNYLMEHPTRADSITEVIQNIYQYRLVESILTQKYYEKTCQSNPNKIKSTIKSLLQKLPIEKEATDATSLRINQLCIELDSIKSHYMDKTFSKISYADFFDMYRDITIAICDLLSQQPNIELIPLNESLMMCCWMTTVNGKEQAIFAFPSKYSTDEIGFISQDIAIARYIRTMLKGVKESNMSR